MNEVTRLVDLMERFGYQHRTAGSVMSWLKKQGLVINDRRGEWVLTENGYEKLDYYRKKLGGVSP